VLVQLFAAAIVAAGMAPVVSHLSGSARAQSWRWRPSPAVVVLLIYLIYLLHDRTSARAVPTTSLSAGTRWRC
jgi:hypothetical protein